LRRDGSVGTFGADLTLTDRGWQRAKGLVRGHRLWETYLAKHSNLPLDHLHAPAERMEHFVSPAMRDRIAEDLPDASTDPHGREIPE